MKRRLLAFFIRSLSSLPPTVAVIYSASLSDSGDTPYNVQTCICRNNHQSLVLHYIPPFFVYRGHVLDAHLPVFIALSLAQTMTSISSNLRVFTSKNVALFDQTSPMPASIVTDAKTGLIVEVIRTYRASVYEEADWIDVGYNYILPGLVEYVVPTIASVIQ